MVGQQWTADGAGQGAPGARGEAPNIFPGQEAAWRAPSAATGCGEAEELVEVATRDDAEPRLPAPVTAKARIAVVSAFRGRAPPLLGAAAQRVNDPWQHR